MSQFGRDLIPSLKCRYLSEIQDSKSNLQTYMNKQIGVNEYTHHIVNIDNLINNIIINRNKLQILNNELGEKDNNLG